MRKKAVLYNTTIDAMLKYGEKAIQKMRNVFLFFAEKDDAVLIWRPHPLLEATLKSMRPDLLDAYLEMVTYYKTQNIGILDESSDLHRAIAISDVYYGDWSSLVDLYQVTGKPVFIQNVEILDTDILPVKWAFSSYTFQIYQDRIYTMAPKGDALLCKGKSDKLSIIKHLIGGSSQALLYNMSVLYEGKLFFSPWHTSSFLRYDIASGEAAEIPIEGLLGNELFYLIQYNGNILAISMKSMNVYKYDIAENLFKCIQRSSKERVLSAFKRVKIYDYIPFADKNTNEICIYNINANEWKIYSFQKGLICDLMYDGEWCWLITETGNIVRLDASTGRCMGEKWISADLKAMFMFDCGKELLLLPEKDAVCIKVEKETLQSGSEVLPVLEDGLYHYFSEIADGQISVECYEKVRKWYAGANEEFWIYNYLENTAAWRDLNNEDERCQAELGKLYAAECWNEARKRRTVLVEHKNRSLNFLYNLLYTEEKLFENVQVEYLQLCGEKIHEIIMEDI